MLHAHVSVVAWLCGLGCGCSWSSLYHLEHLPPLQLHNKQEHVIELGKLGLDCLIMSEPPVDLGPACHCISATLATLAANAACARFMMDAPGGIVVRSVLALVEVRGGWAWC